MAHYDWVPLPKRKRLRWPGGQRLALILTINLEYWDRTKDSSASYYAGGPPVIPDPLPGNVFDSPNFTWREYGQRVGAWRMFDIFAEAGAPASCTINAKIALERRELVDAVNERGWEIVAHNYEQGELLSRYAFEPERERAVINETLRVYEQAVGHKAKGWLSSSLRGTERTPDFCAEAGLIFFCDYFNDDQPYLIHTPHGPIVSTPYSVEINDFTIMVRRGLGNEAALQTLKDQFDQLYAEGAESGRMMNVGLHPHVAGVPHRARVLREFLGYAKRHDGVWWTTREQVASWYLQNHASHIG
jgi:peptidoglycan/xylan/chitin deacetylase (PgdA/CDA1 family)